MKLEKGIEALMTGLPLEKTDQERLRRLMCPELPGMEDEIKPYPKTEGLPAFALIWRLEQGRLEAAIFPAKTAYRCVFELEKLKKTQRHTHNYIELAYVVSGRFRQRILDKDVVFSEGELCLVDKNSLHQDYLGEEAATVVFLGISPALFEKLEVSKAVGVKILTFLRSALLNQKNIYQYLHFKPMNKEDGKMAALMADLLGELASRRTGCVEICTGLMLRVFDYLSTDYELSVSKELRKTVNWMRFESVSDYMRAHYKEVTLGELSRVFHFQEDYFNRLIRNKTGLTYSAYLQSIRLEMARELLIADPRGIDEIIREAGYHNKGYFYRLFKEKYGMTPKKYREQYGK
ncbi:MAG: AraC family transcriptional regulator [Eubacterium sp.]|nr:AraC family transcriptional regulator [Eubacterium sp.]